MVEKQLNVHGNLTNISWAVYSPEKQILNGSPTPPSPLTSRRTSVRLHSNLVWKLRASSTSTNHPTPVSLRLSSGVSVCGVGERPERPLSGLPGRQQPDPNRTQDDCHGGDGGGISWRWATTESLFAQKVFRGLALDLESYSNRATWTIWDAPPVLPCSQVVWIRCVTERQSVFFFSFFKDEGNSAQVNDSTCRQNTGHTWFFFVFSSLNLEVQSAKATSRDGYPSMCPHRLPVLLKRHPDFAFLFEFQTGTVSWICCWTWCVFKGRQDGARLRLEVGGERAKAASLNKEEYLMSMGSATSPRVGLPACMEAPVGSTLPSAGRDGTTHSEGAFILQ